MQSYLCLAVIAVVPVLSRPLQLDIDHATLEDVIRAFGEPVEYGWGEQTFGKDGLPAQYIVFYPNGFTVYMRKGRVVEVRHHEPGYLFHGKLQVGSSIDEVLKEVGKPTETVVGAPNKFRDGVLYKDIDGRTGRCYYARAAKGVRFFFMNRQVTSLYITSGIYKGGLPAGDRVKSERSESKAGRAWNEAFERLEHFFAEVEDYADVRSRPLGFFDFSAQPNLLATLTFNEKTIWPEPGRMPADSDPNRLLRQAMNPGLGIRDLHRQGITGRGVNVAIIDQPIYLDHPEFAGKIPAYHDVGCDSETSMHGPAVASLLVGTKCGTAPGARVYYVAAPSWSADSAYQAEALDWIIEQNAALPASQKIRVVSVSAAPSGRGSPFTKNRGMWDEAYARAEAAGILVLDCTRHHGFVAPCWYDPADPEDVSKCTPGYPGMPAWPTSPARILVPASPRTTAEQRSKGDHTYQYCGRGGLSWAIPYCAGVLALGWQIRPDIPPRQMRDLLFESGHTTETDARIIDPPAFVSLVREAKASP